MYYRDHAFLSYLNKYVLFCIFQVNILKRVLEEVEKVMQEFKAMLYKSMEDPHIDLTNVSL